MQSNSYPLYVISEKKPTLSFQTSRNAFMGVGALLCSFLCIFSNWLFFVLCWSVYQCNQSHGKTHLKMSFYLNQTIVSSSSIMTCAAQRCEINHIHCTKSWATGIVRRQCQVLGYTTVPKISCKSYYTPSGQSLFTSKILVPFSRPTPLLRHTQYTYPLTKSYCTVH